jgi:serine phosphatase RsbU (regulator of sigma subunit)
MFDQNEIGLQERNTSSEASETPQAQPRDWEKTAKGLQARNDKLAADLKAQQALATQYLARYQELEAARQGSAQANQGQINELKTQLDSLLRERDAFKSHAERLEQEYAKVQKTQTVRETLVASDKYRDLLPFFDAGHLSVDGLEGEALQERLESFRSLLQNKAIVETEKKYANASPPPVTPGSSKSSGMTFDQLSDWMADPKNFASPEFAAMQELYYQEASKTLNK